MKRDHLRWLINPLFLLVTATCNTGGIQGGDCQSGADTDSDGLADDIECRIGSDPNKADSNDDGLLDGDAYNRGLDPTKLDSDGDGVPDSREVLYPKICVAQDRNAQRRPPTVCTAATECQTGEDCLGLDPTKTDSDGDGVLDKDEDIDSNGTIDFASGETDPRLWDTDGDGKNDAESGAAICRPDGLGMVVQKPISAIQLGHDPAFGTAVDVTGTSGNRTAVVVNDATAQVAGVTISSPTRGADVRADATAVEADIRTALVVGGTTVTPVLVQSTFTTHEGFPALRSLFLITTTANSSASAQRDGVINRLTGGTAPTGTAVGGGTTTFYLDVSTVRRSAALNDIVIGVAPTTAYNNTANSTSIRVEDLVNATDVADNFRQLDYVCQGIIASRLPTADFIWTVDTSGSMDDDQDRLGQAAVRFFNKMTSAGVDFRVGVFRASAGTVNFTTTVANQWASGFEFILGTDVNGPSKLARYVTDEIFTGAGGDNPNFQPFPIAGGNTEEPVAAAVIVNTEFKRRASIGDTNPNYTLRPGATKVAFFVTDEPTAAEQNNPAEANDWQRYFSTANNPDTGTRFAPAGTYSAAVLDGIANYWRTNNFLTYGMVPAYNRVCKPTVTNSVVDLPRCVIEGNGGAYIDIAQATNQTIVDAALDRIANDVIGASSPIILQRSPITHTIKVTVRGNLVPRSRSNGFDYNQASKSIVFYGNTYRPQLGDTVYVSYRVWKDAVG